jgi:hypothetical protein
VLYGADGEQEADEILARAVGTLREVCGLREPAYAVPFSHLVEFVASDPVAGLDPASDVEVTVVPPDALARLTLPLTSPRRDLEVLCLTRHLAFSLSRPVKGPVTHATPFFEKLLGVPVTSRSLGTITRLVNKYRDFPA